MSDTPAGKFPSPREVNGGSNELSVRFKMDVRGVFPYSLELTGDCYQMEQILPIMA